MTGSALALALGVTVGCAHAEEPGADAGAKLLAPFKRDLQQALREGLAKGPAEAVAACRVRAPEIANARSQEGIRLGRASHRLRNPANVPPDWVAPILDAYVATPSERSPRTVRLGEGRAGYTEPILLQPLCLSCHGDALAPGVADRIEELYPHDRAIGFQVGELRGVFWVEFPTE